VLTVVVRTGRVVTKWVVGGVVVVVVVDDAAEFQILNRQNVGSIDKDTIDSLMNLKIVPVIGALSGPQKAVPLAVPLLNRM
jgi:hypothetical protein